MFHPSRHFDFRQQLPPTHGQQKQYSKNVDTGSPRLQSPSSAAYFHQHNHHQHTQYPQHRARQLSKTLPPPVSPHRNSGNRIYLSSLNTSTQSSSNSQWTDSNSSLPNLSNCLSSQHSSDSHLSPTTPPNKDSVDFFSHSNRSSMCSNSTNNTNKSVDLHTTLPPPKKTSIASLKPRNSLNLPLVRIPSHIAQQNSQDTPATDDDEEEEEEEEEEKDDTKNDDDIKQTARHSIEIEASKKGHVRGCSSVTGLPFPFNIEPFYKLSQAFDWSKKGLIGSGGESDVYMVVKKENHHSTFNKLLSNKVYAIKCSYYYYNGDEHEISKQKIIDENRLQHIYGGIDTYCIYHQYNKFSGEGQFYFVQDLVDVSLRDVIYNENSTLKSLTYEQREPFAKSYIFQILNKLQTIHHDGLIHGDLKCENILIKKAISGGSCCAQDRLKIIDFGLSKECPFGKSLHAKSEYFFGSLGYSPPEMYKYKQSREYNHSIDIWAVGILCSEIIMRQNITYFDKLHKNAVFIKKQAKHRHKTLFSIKMRLYWERIKKLNILKEISERLKWEPGVLGVPGASNDCCNFVASCLHTNANHRITAQNALKHPWFKEYYQ